MIFFENIFSENIFGKNIFAKNIFAKNIFSLQPLTVHHLYTTPTPSYPLFEVECDGERTYGPDGARNDCSFYIYR